MTPLGWAVVIWFGITAVLNVSVIGKPREPLTANTAAVIVVIDLVVIGLILSGFLR